MESERCGNCKFKTEGSESYECHRNPPKFVFHGSVKETHWPEVGPHDWCGEWKEGD